MLGPVLHHHIGKLVVHIRFDASSSITFCRGFFANKLRTHWSSSGECLHNGLSLKLDHSFAEKGVVHPASTGPRLCSVLNFKPEELKTIYIGLNPVFSAGNIVLKLSNEVASKLRKLLFIEYFSEILAKLVLFGLIPIRLLLVALAEVNFKLKFEIVRICRRVAHRKTQRGLIKSLINSHQ